MTDWAAIDVLRRNARQLQRALKRLTLIITVVRALALTLAAVSVTAVATGVLWYDTDCWHGFMVLVPTAIVLHLLNDRRDTLEERRAMCSTALSTILIDMERELARCTKETVS